MDLKSVNNLLEFLEKVFNGGSGEEGFGGWLKIVSWCASRLGRECSTAARVSAPCGMDRGVGQHMPVQAATCREAQRHGILHAAIQPCPPPYLPLGRLQRACAKVPGPADGRQVGQLGHPAGALCLYFFVAITFCYSLGNRDQSQVGQLGHPAGALLCIQLGTMVHLLPAWANADILLVRCGAFVFEVKRRMASRLPAASLVSKPPMTILLIPQTRALQVSDGELRQPGPEIMRKLAGAKDKLG